MFETLTDGIRLNELVVKGDEMDVKKVSAVAS